jgi:hypothetical protein
MERAKLLRRPDPRDLRTLQRWVELATKKDCRRQKVVAVICVEDEIVRVTARRSGAPPTEQIDHIGDEVDVSSFTVLRRADGAPRVTPTDSYHSVSEIDLAPPERQQFPLPHPRLQRHKAKGSIRLFAEVAEEPRQLVVLEVRRLLPLGSWSLRRRQLPNRIGLGVTVEDGCLHARTEHPQVLRPRRRRAALLSQEKVEASDVFRP